MHGAGGFLEVVSLVGNTQQSNSWKGRGSMGSLGYADKLTDKKDLGPVGLQEYFEDVQSIEVKVTELAGWVGVPLEL